MICVCMYDCMHVCMIIRMCVWLYAWLYAFLFVCMYDCMTVRMFVCIHLTFMSTDRMRNSNSSFLNILYLPRVPCTKIVFSGLKSPKSCTARPKIAKIAGVDFSNTLVWRPPPRYRFIASPPQKISWSCNGWPPGVRVVWVFGRHWRMNWACLRNRFGTGGRG